MSCSVRQANVGGTAPRAGGPRFRDPHDEGEMRGRDPAPGQNTVLCHWMWGQFSNRGKEPQGQRQAAAKRTGIIADIHRELPQLARHRVSTVHTRSAHSRLTPTLRGRRYCYCRLKARSQAQTG